MRERRQEGAKFKIEKRHSKESGMKRMEKKGGGNEIKNIHFTENTLIHTHSVPYVLAYI